MSWNLRGNRKSSYKMLGVILFVIIFLLLFTFLNNTFEQAMENGFINYVLVIFTFSISGTLAYTIAKIC